MDSLTAALSMAKEKIGKVSDACYSMSAVIEDQMYYLFRFQCGNYNESHSAESVRYESIYMCHHLLEGRSNQPVLIRIIYLTVIIYVF